MPRVSRKVSRPNYRALAGVEGPEGQKPRRTAAEMAADRRKQDVAQKALAAKHAESLKRIVDAEDAIDQEARDSTQVCFALFETAV